MREADTDTWQTTTVAPKAGEMVLVGEQFGCIMRVIGSINGHWWVETSAAPYGLIQGVLHDWGRTRMWSVRPYSG